MMQEEIMIMTSPECLIPIVLSEFMLDHEAIIFNGPRQYSTYEGYGDDFICTGKASGHKESPRMIAAIDALCMLEFEPGYQYSRNAILRDLNKAYLGFMGFDDEICEVRRSVSSGTWGCGVFKNDPEMKFFQQWIASSRAKRNLDFYTKGAGDYSDELNKFVEKFKNESIGYLLKMLLQYSDFFFKEDEKLTLFELLLK
jgi:Poly (ADP-ribose) glycohydrolase (PARG)